MIRNPKELSEPIKKAVNVKGVLYSHLLLASTVMVHTLFDPTSTQIQVIGTTVIIGVFLILLFSRFFDIASVNNRPFVYLVVYHILASLALVFLTDPTTPYYLLWFILLFFTNLYYGEKGVWRSIAVLGIATLIKVTYITTLPASEKDYWNIFASFFTFVALTILFNNIQKVYNWDREQLKTTGQIALLEQKRLEGLINTITEGILVVDSAGKVTRHNASVLGLLNTHTSLMGQPLESVAKFETAEGKSFDIRQILSPITPVLREDIHVRYGPEDTAILKIIASPIKPSAQMPQQDGYIISLRDITKEKSLEDERNEFVSIFSHELRTPISIAEASISNAIIFNKNKLDAEQIAHSMTEAHDQVMFLANIINDLASYVDLQNEQQVETKETFDLTAEIQKISDTYAKQAQEKNIKLQVNNSSNDKLDALSANRLHLRKVVDILLNNAFKYTSSGSISVMAAKSDTSTIIKIEDTGIGIATADQKKIFDKFFRSEDFHTRQTGGIGLGLYLARKISLANGWSLDVESEPGKGSTFVLSIP